MPNHTFQYPKVTPISAAPADGTPQQAQPVSAPAQQR
jgi:hypothetical protein